MQNALKRAAAVHSEGRPKRQLPVDRRECPSSGSGRCIGCRRGNGRRCKRRANGRKEGKEEKKEGTAKVRKQGKRGKDERVCGNEKGEGTGKESSKEGTDGLLGGQGPNRVLGLGCRTRRVEMPWGQAPVGLSVRRARQVRRVERKRGEMLRQERAVPFCEM